jgi:hypothetical protein
MEGLEILPSWYGLLWRFFHESLLNQPHEKEQRFGFDDQHPRRTVFERVEVLMHATRCNQDKIAGVPVVALAVMDVITFAL